MRPHLVGPIALSVLLVAGSAHAGGAITSGTTVAGNITGPGYLEQWTFSGTAGQRILITAVTTGGSLDTNIFLKKPVSGVVETSGSSDRLEWQLASTGTYTIEIQDVGLNDAGTYAVSFLNITAGPYNDGGDTDGGPIASSDVMTGTMSGVSDTDAFTFTGYANSRIAIDAVETGGPGFNTYISLYPPAGGAAVYQSTGNRFDVNLPSTGTWTIVIEDNGDNTAGSYAISMLSILSGPFTNGGDPDGGAIASNQIKTGSFQQGVDMDAYTLFAFASNRILIAGLTTSGSANTTLTLYPPNGGAAVTYTSSGDRIDFQVTTTGTYSLVIEDYGNTNTGNYTISYMNVSSGPYADSVDPDGLLVGSSDVKTGTMSGVGDFDVFRFSGKAGERVAIDAVETAGASFNTVISLYPPGGGSALLYSGSNRQEAQLTVSGAWMIVIEDLGNDTSGSYALSLLNISAGPYVNVGDPNGGPIASSEIRSGAFQQGVDMDGYTFTATSGSRIVLVAVASGAGTHNTTITLYPPGGGGAVTYSSGGDRLEAQLPATGAYVAVVEDYGNANTGNYTMSYTNVSTGPYTNGGDTDGGAIASADARTGSTSGTGDLDVFTFTGNTGDRILMDAVETGGVGYNTVVSLYPPNGAPPFVQSASNRQETQLTMTGTWKMVIEDNGDDTAGNYAVSILNVTSGPLTSVADTDGGAIASNQIKTGSFQQGVDFDAFTFTASAGDRVVMVGLATGGATNTTLTIYPPGGLAAMAYSSSGDRLDTRITYAGNYTCVMEDYGNTNAGSYTISFTNVTSGPYTDGSDANGGAIASADVKTGSTSGGGDLDVYSFSGTTGQRVIIDAVETGGVGYNTVISLYPPDGDNPIRQSSTNRQEAVLTSTGTWHIVIEDNFDDTAGNYALSLLNVTSGPLTNGADTDGGAILSNEIKTGSLQQGVDLDAFTFTGTAGARIILTCVTTSGSANTALTLYPPNGAATIGYSSGGDRLELRLPGNGTYTCVIEDYGNTNPGDYTVSYLNVTNGPYTDGSDADGGAITSNGLLTGTTSGVGDLDAYTFFGTYGDRVLMAGVETGGATYNTVLSLYPPDGTAPLVQASGNRPEALLNASGVWTIVVEDVGVDTPGSYAVSLLNLTHGPYSGGAETDGGPVTTKGAAFHGTIFSAGDFDGYTFYGVTGMTANISATVQSGVMDSNIALYPPGGGGAIVYTTSDNATPVLPADGYYTIVIEDYGLDQTGNYTLTVNTSGGVTGVGDTPPAELALHPGVPSPFSQSTRIDYDLASADHVRIGVYDVTGARIRTLVETSRAAGRYATTWDGRDDSGRRVASGVYYLRMETRAAIKRQKLVLVR